MKLSSLKVFLETMCYYNTVNIKQVFAAEGGASLSVRCVRGTNSFELTHSETHEVVHIKSIDQTAEYIMAFVESYSVSTSS